MAHMDRLHTRRRAWAIAGLGAVALSAGCATVDGASLGESLSPAVRRGEVFARANCAEYHALGSANDSPHPAAPAFRRIQRYYNPLSLERELEAIPQAGHYMMRPVPMERADIEDLLAYIDSLD